MGRPNSKTLTQARDAEIAKIADQISRSALRRCPPASSTWRHGTMCLFSRFNPGQALIHEVSAHPASKSKTT
jgi:hypothetical protein